MTILEQFVRDGDRLFRWRSHLPLVLVPVLVTAVLVEGRPLISLAAERSWEVFAVVVALFGLTIRAWAVGTAPVGTSERSTVNPRASELRTTGLYSMVRHPLYLANGLMVFGIALFPGIWYLPPIVFLATVLYYERIAAREEQFLEGQFGAAFQAWAARVPAIVPRVSGHVRSASAMSWRKVLRGEFYGLLTITASVFVLDAVQAWRRTRTWQADALWTWIFVATAAMFLVVRTLKKTTRVFEPRN